MPDNLCVYKGYLHLYVNVRWIKVLAHCYTWWQCIKKLDWSHGPAAVLFKKSYKIFFSSKNQSFNRCFKIRHNMSTLSHNYFILLDVCQYNQWVYKIKKRRLFETASRRAPSTGDKYAAKIITMYLSTTRSRWFIVTTRNTRNR